MSKASMYTANEALEWGIDNKNFPYIDAKTLSEDTEYNCNGIYFVKGKYGSHPVVISDGVNVSFPEANKGVCEKVLADSECVTEIKQGIVKFKIRKFKSEKYGTESCAIVFI